jgi:hypothetical protein
LHFVPENVVGAGTTDGHDVPLPTQKTKPG